jgi:hypothetical protein
VFHMDVAKVDSNVAYVAMVVHVCCKLLFSMFHLFFFRRTLQVCLSECCICLTHMLASVLSGYYICYAMVSSVFRYFCKCFRYMFQLFHLPLDICCKCCI